MDLEPIGHRLRSSWVTIYKIGFITRDHFTIFGLSGGVLVLANSPLRESVVLGTHPVIILYPSGRIMGTMQY